MKRFLLCLILITVFSSACSALAEGSNQIIVVDDCCELQLEYITMTEVNAADDRYITASIMILFTNLSTKKVTIDKVISAVSLSFMGRYVFTPESTSLYYKIIEDTYDGYSYSPNPTQNYVFDPLCEMGIKYSVNIPKMVAASNDSLILNVTVADKGEQEFILR